ncbi:MAG: DNA repair protein RecO [Candidatus Sedimenticola sp. PURPLELP]
MEQSQSLALQPAFILHRAPYSNSSLLLECLTPFQGRFPIIAKGANSASGKKTGNSLQPFMPLLISWSGRGDVKTLRNHDAGDKPVQLHGKALYCGFYINELLMRLVHRNDPSEILFTLYQDTIRQLAVSRDLDSLLRRFELTMLRELGYGLNLECDADTGEAIESSDIYHYEIEKGPVRTDSRQEHTLSGKTLLGLSGDTELDREGKREAKRLLRRVISYYIGDKPLKSRELFKSITSAN